MIRFVLLNIKGQTDSGTLFKQMNKFLYENFAQIADTQEGFDVATPNEINDILENWIHKGPDMKDILSNWKNSGLRVGIFSQDSTNALNKLIEAQFDDSLGSENDPKTFKIISKRLDLQPFEIMYVSFSEESLDAARSAGLKTVRLFSKYVRPSKHAVSTSLQDISLT